MTSEKIGTAPAPQIRSGTNPNSQLRFSEAFAGVPQPPHRIFPGDPGPKSATRELTAGFQEHQRYFNASLGHQWISKVRSSDIDESEEDDGEYDEDSSDDDDDNDEDESNFEKAVTLVETGESNRIERYDTARKSENMKDHIPALGIKEGIVAQNGNEINNENDSSCELRNARGGQMYYPRFLNGAEDPSSSSNQKDIVVMENGCGFSGRKDSSYLSGSGESLRVIFSDPITGTLMDDAMILPCGHSFGSGGIQQIIRTKTCHTCSQPVSDDSIAPNLSLRLAVQAYMREEDLQVNRTLKRRRERFERDKGTSGDSVLPDHLRGRGVQFPFVVTDRVIIKGNKRTPPRFVGREAIVTTQCLNGWYVVKTLDNAESVKLQYRSLSKVTENNPSSKAVPIKMTPIWL